MITRSFSVICLVALASCARNDQLLHKSLNAFSEEAHAAELSAADRTVTYPNFQFAFELPADWYLSPIGQVERRLGFRMYMYGRKALVDSHGEKVVATITVIPEKLPKHLSFVQYTALCGRPATTDEVFSQIDGRIALKEAVGYKARYVDELKVEHTIYVVHAVHDWTGVQIVMDVTSELFSRVEGDFASALKSLRFTE